MGAVAVSFLSLVGIAVPASQSMAATVSVTTQAQLTAAIAAAQPGQTIALSAGTYNGGVTIPRSATPTAPITLTAAGNGPVVLTASLTMPSCSSTSPDPNRTVRIKRGASYWTINGLSIDGGVMIMGENAGVVKNWFSARVDAKDWQARRAVPGRSTNDPVAARSAISYLAAQTGVTLLPSDGIKITNNVITRKGIHSAMNRYGTISGNTISDIACGTGAGIWMGNYSDGWTISDNRLSRIAASSVKHYMQEGIRIGGASSYLAVSGNVVTDLPLGGRAFNTDEDASYNVFRDNGADQVDIGYSEQMSGWGNVWERNRVTNYRVAGFVFRAMDGSLALPSMDTSSYAAVARCNSASGQGPALRIGGVMKGTFQSNSFASTSLSKNVVSYWGAEGNTWNGSTVAPTSTPSVSTVGC